MNMRTQNTGRSKRAMGTLAIIACLLVCVGLAACSPQAPSAPSTPSTSDEQKAPGTEDKQGTDSEKPSFSAVADFTDRSTGMYPDVQNNAKYQNEGNRGCSACHTDLWDTDKNNGSYVHITPYVGLKEATYTGDCQTCHAWSVLRCGNAMAENIHVSHYSNQTFLDANGNCWSCHVMYTDKDFNTTIKLYEEVQYEAGFGGYPNNDQDATIAWNKSRGFETGFLAGTSADSEPTVSVDFDQAPNKEEDEFLCVNFIREDGNDVYASIDPATWKLEVTGASGTSSYTLDDLKAMPQTETTKSQWCVLNGVNSGMIDNMPMKGIKMEDFAQAVGVGDANAVSFTCLDNWTGLGKDNLGLQYLIDNKAMIVLENYGHDLTAYQGGPAKLFIPGTGGSASLKNLASITFSKVDEPVMLKTASITAEAKVATSGSAVATNTSWFDNDGVEGKVGQELVLEGASYGWHIGDAECNPVQILFSIDYGRTWMTYDVPSDFDPDQWAHFTFKWTPKEAGTYVVKAKAIAANGNEQVAVSNLLVTVAE